MSRLSTAAGNKYHGTAESMGEGGKGQGPERLNRPGTDASDATERMRRAIAATARSAGWRGELEEAAKALVRALRAEHDRPEVTMLRIKQILAEAGLRPTYSPMNDAAIVPGTAAAIYRDVIAWSIRYYYADDGARGDAVD